MFKDLLKFVREEVVSVRKRTNIKPPKAETSMEPYESYKIDFHLFETMFTIISPLAKNNGADILTVRLFKVILFTQKYFIHNLTMLFKIVLLVDGHG